jgi:hypothetical protein
MAWQDASSNLACPARMRLHTLETRHRLQMGSTGLNRGYENTLSKEASCPQTYGIVPRSSADCSLSDEQYYPPLVEAAFVVRPPVTKIGLRSKSFDDHDCRQPARNWRVVALLL